MKRLGWEYHQQGQGNDAETLFEKVVPVKLLRYCDLETCRAMDRIGWGPKILGERGRSTRGGLGEEKTDPRGYASRDAAYYEPHDHFPPRKSM